MKSRIVMILALVVLVFSSTVEAQKQDQSAKVEEKVLKIKRLRQEISYLNLLNGLNLSTDQCKKLLAMLKEQEQFKQSLGSDSDKLLDNTEEAFTKLKKALEKNQGIPKEIEKKSQKLNKVSKDKHEEFLRMRSRHAKELEGMLSDAQKDIVSQFKACLIPGASCYSLTTPKKAQALLTPRRRYVVLALTRGRRRMSSLAAGRVTAGTAKTRTAYSIITSSR